MQTIAGLTVFISLACSLYAVDGVVLINQNAALAGNVTPGDAPGFPVTISLPGSYKLSGNLTVPNANTDGIVITADNVTIDLNGFSIIGPTVCSGGFFTVTACSPTGTGNGILAAHNTAISVVNGAFRGMGADGLHLDGAQLRVENIHASSNGGSGIYAFAQGDALVSSCTSSRNGNVGIFSDLVTKSTALGNLDAGIVFAGSAVTNIVNLNGSDGLRGSGVISGNSVSDNGGFGIASQCPSTLVANRVFNNSRGDILANGSSCVRADNSPAP